MIPPEPSRESSDGALFFSISDNSATPHRKDRSSPNLSKVMSDLCHSQQVPDEDGNQASETPQEERYGMRIRSNPSDSACGAK